MSVVAKIDKIGHRSVETMSNIPYTLENSTLKESFFSSQFDVNSKPKCLDGKWKCLKFCPFHYHWLAGHVGPKCYTTSFEPIVSLSAVLTWKRRPRTPYHIHIPNPKCVKIPWVLASAINQLRSNRLKKILFHQCPCNGGKKVSLLNHHKPNYSGVPQNLTWCQWFGETKIHATKKAILRCFYFPKQFSWPGAQCSPKTMILRVNLRYFGTL